MTEQSFMRLAMGFAGRMPLEEGALVAWDLAPDRGAAARAGAEGEAGRGVLPRARGRSRGLQHASPHLLPPRAVQSP